MVKILVDGLMHVGDILIASSVLPVLKKAYPESRITYLTYGNLCAAAQMLEGVDDVYAYDYKSGGGFVQGIRVARELRKRHYDIGISLDPRERITLIKWGAGIPVRLSLERALGWNLGWERQFYTADLPLEGWDVTKHRMAESFQEILRRYFHDEEKVFIPGRFKPSAEEDVQAIERMLATACKERIPGKTRIALCFQTTMQYRDWPVDKFSALADRLVETYDADIILTGMAFHQEKGERIISGMKHRDAALNFIGKTSFRQLVALFRKVDVLVILDTGSAHIAAAAGCPVVTIFTYNSPEVYEAAIEKSRAVSLYVPCSGKKICRHPGECMKYLCVDGITVEQVFKSVSEML